MPILKARRAERQGTESEALDMVDKALFGHLGTTTSDGFPYVVPMNHVLVGRTLYLHSAPEGEKMAGIRRDDRVCFEVSEMLSLVPAEVPCAYSVAYRSAICFGRARIVESPEEKSHALHALALKYSGKPGPISAKDAQHVCVLAVDVQAATCKSRMP